MDPVLRKQREVMMNAASARAIKKREDKRKADLAWAEPLSAEGYKAMGVQARGQSPSITVANLACNPLKFPFTEEAFVTALDGKVYDGPRELFEHFEFNCNNFETTGVNGIQKHIKDYPRMDVTVLAKELAEICKTWTHREAYIVLYTPDNDTDRCFGIELYGGKRVFGK